MNLGTATTFCLCIVLGGEVLHARQQSDIDKALQRSTQRAQKSQKFDLKYRMQEGEVLRWQVEQIASTDVSMAGYEEKSSLRSRSVICWTVQGVGTDGNMTIQDQLESAVEWQKVGDEDPVSYDSTTDQEIPDIYRATAEKVGKPISTHTISPAGEMVNRVEHIKTVEFGMGRITLLLPVEPVAIDAQWHTPEQLQARRGNGTVKNIQTRMLYTLRKVENGIATISFRREVLTPIEDPKVKSQIQQKMNSGALSFDIQRGRIVKKVVHWDEKVQGFEGDDSFLHYIGSYTMNLIENEESTTSHQGSNPLQPVKRETGERSSSYIRPRQGRPVIRK